jgi:hypothetical protein
MRKTKIIFWVTIVVALLSSNSFAQDKNKSMKEIIQNGSSSIIKTGINAIQEMRINQENKTNAEISKKGNNEAILLGQEFREKNVKVLLPENLKEVKVSETLLIEQRFDDSTDQLKITGKIKFLIKISYPYADITTVKTFDNEESKRNYMRMMAQYKNMNDGAKTKFFTTVNKAFLTEKDNKLIFNYELKKNNSIERHSRAIVKDPKIAFFPYMYQESLSRILFAGVSLREYLKLNINKDVARKSYAGEGKINRSWYVDFKNNPTYVKYFILPGEYSIYKGKTYFIENKTITPSDSLTLTFARYNERVLLLQVSTNEQEYYISADNAVSKIQLYKLNNKIYCYYSIDTSKGKVAGEELIAEIK